METALSPRRGVRSTKSVAQYPQVCSLKWCSRLRGVRFSETAVSFSRFYRSACVVSLPPLSYRLSNVCLWHTLGRPIAIRDMSSPITEMIAGRLQRLLCPITPPSLTQPRFKSRQKPDLTRDHIVRSIRRTYCLTKLFFYRVRGRHWTGP